MENPRTPTSTQAVVFTFPLNPRKITDAFRSDIQAINFLTPAEAFGSNLALKRPSNTSIKLYLPNFSSEGFSTSFSVPNTVSEMRLARLMGVYSLAASMRRFNFVHYIAETHLIICLLIASPKGTEEYEKSLQVLGDLHSLLQAEPGEGNHQ